MRMLLEAGAEPDVQCSVVRARRKAHNSFFAFRRDVKVAQEGLPIIIVFVVCRRRVATPLCTWPLREETSRHSRTC